MAGRPSAAPDEGGDDREEDMEICLKRAYEPPGEDDGTRVLVDRVWPRGLSKEEAGFDAWLKEIAPSTVLRQWFAHDPARWEQFVEKYFLELDSHRELVASLVARAKGGRLTLLFGAKDKEHNNAVALKRYLEAMTAEAQSGVTPKEGLGKEEKSVQSVLDFTFKKLNEAIAQAGKTGGRMADGAAGSPQQKKGPGVSSPQEEFATTPCPEDTANHWHTQRKRRRT